VPTGVHLRDARQQLFDAAERVLLRDGPNALTSRAVTDEAGCAKGVLHRHFTDFDAFLTDLAQAAAAADARATHRPHGTGDHRWARLRPEPAPRPLQLGIDAPPALRVCSAFDELTRGDLTTPHRGITMPEARTTQQFLSMREQSHSCGQLRGHVDGDESSAASRAPSGAP
jgi:AcrR family transcriptional regulator